MTVNPVHFSNDPAQNSQDSDLPCTLMAGVVRFLQNRPTWDEVAQFLVLGGVSSLDVRQAAIYEIRPDLHLRVLGTFGDEARKGDLNGLAGHDIGLLKSLLHSGEPQTNLTRGSTVEQDGDPSVGNREVISSYPELLWPLATPIGLNGVLQLRFNDRELPGRTDTELSQVAAVLSLLLDIIRSHEDLDPGDMTQQIRAKVNAHQNAFRIGVGEASANGQSGLWNRRAKEPDRLTARQLQVLGYMADGKTNSQIARLLKFSESTIRQETMAIYRFLQVPGRREAVEVARNQGILHQAVVAKGSRPESTVVVSGVVYRPNEK